VVGGRGAKSPRLGLRRVTEAARDHKGGCLGLLGSVLVVAGVKGSLGLAEPWVLGAASSCRILMGIASGATNRKGLIVIRHLVGVVAVWRVIGTSVSLIKLRHWGSKVVLVDRVRDSTSGSLH
jgi:hypothetical protein